MLRFLHRSADEIAPLSPRAVIVLDVLESEQVLQREPCQARSLADAAVRDDRLIVADALRRIQGAELIEVLERAVVVAVFPPRDVLRAGNMAAALARFRQSGRRQN